MDKAEDIHIIVIMMTGESNIAKNQLDILKNEYIPIFKQKLGYFYQLSAEFTNLSTKLLSRPDVTLYNDLKNSCQLNSKLLYELNSELELKIKFLSEQILLTKDEKMQMLNNLNHSDSKLETLQNQFKMMKEDELNFLVEINFLKEKKRKLRLAEKQEKKMINETFKNNLKYINEQERKIAEYNDKFSLLKQEKKNFNRAIFGLDMNIYKYSEICKKKETEIEDLEKDVKGLEEKCEKTQNESFELELNIKYLQKKTKIWEEECEGINKENEKIYNKFADTAIQIEKKKQINDKSKAELEKVEKQYEMSLELEIEKVQEIFEAIKKRKNKTIDFIFNCYKITKSFVTWIKFTKLSKFLKQATNEINLEFEDFKQTELKYVEDEKRHLESCIDNNKKKSIRKSSSRSKNKPEKIEKPDLIEKVQIVEKPEKVENVKIDEKIEVVEKKEICDNFLKPNTPPVNVGYSKKRIKGLKDYKSDFNRDYFH